MPKLNLRSALRIKLPAGEIKQLKGDGFAWPEAGAAPPGDSPAAWFTPGAPFAVTPASPEIYTKATLAWSYRHDAGEINFPRPTNKMLADGKGGFFDIEDGDDVAGRQFNAFAIAWDWANVYLTDVVTGFIKPAQTHNFVVVWDTAGGLSGGNTMQIWCNGTLVSSTSTALTSFAIYSMTLLGAGATVLPGETQGFWFSNDSVITPATVFAELFDGANGMRDLADTTIGGVVPDAVQIGP